MAENDFSSEEKMEEELETIYKRVMQKQTKQVYKDEATGYYNNAKASHGDEKAYHMRLLLSMLDF